MRRPTETRLRRAFADVLTAMLATAAGAAVIAGGVGCGGTATQVGDPNGVDGGGPSGEGGGPTPNPGFTSLCGDFAKSTFLSGLHSSPPFDGAEMRGETAFAPNANGQGGAVTPGDDVDDHWKATDNEKVGALCTKAKDPAACNAKVSGYRVLPTTRAACMMQYPANQFAQAACSATYILYTRGDEIGVARNNAETKALIGTFDTIEEALWATNVANAAYTQSCGQSAQGRADSEYRTTADGGFDVRLIENTCGADSFNVLLHVDYAGNVTVLSRDKIDQQQGCAVAGRRPEGLRVERLLASGNAVGEHFAAMATLEAASVTAFRRLQRQLATHGAPPALLARIRKAARDEVRHARATGALARKYGVTPSAPQIAAAEESPSLFAIALENAREGCVRETYGALVAHLQMNRAGDADVRACMAAIADEETEHAALSWDIAAWIQSQLGDEERAKLATERRDAFATLARDLAVPVDPRVEHASGVPSASEALRMLEGLEPIMLAA